jgi:hypothetical protein
MKRALSRLRIVAKTRCPRRAISSAVYFPIPELHPVIKATAI